MAKTDVDAEVVIKAMKMYVSIGMFDYCRKFVRQLTL